MCVSCSNSNHHAVFIVCQLERLRYLTSMATTWEAWITSLMRSLLLWWWWMKSAVRHLHQSIQLLHMERVLMVCDRQSGNRYHFFNKFMLALANGTQSSRNTANYKVHPITSFKSTECTEVILPGKDSRIGGQRKAFGTCKWLNQKRTIYTCFLVLCSTKTGENWKKSYIHYSLDCSLESLYITADKPSLHLATTQNYTPD